jgi:hypothetical protein
MWNGRDQLNYPGFSASTEWEKLRKSSVGTACVVTQIQTRFVPNTTEAVNLLGMADNRFIF